MKGTTNIWLWKMLSHPRGIHVELWDGPIGNGTFLEATAIEVITGALTYGVAIRGKAPLSPNKYLPAGKWHLKFRLTNDEFPFDIPTDPTSTKGLILEMLGNTSMVPGDTFDVAVDLTLS